MCSWRTLLLLVSFSPAALAQWQVQQSNTTSDLRGVSAVSDQVAWASGDQGTVLHTGDGGATWQKCAMPTEAARLDFRGVQGFDARTALVMSSGKGELSRVYRTIDGCKSWELVFQNPDPDGVWDSMQFQYRPGKTPAEKGYYAYGVLVGHPVGGEFQIFTSRDYGTTWKALHDDEAFSPGPSAWAKPGEVTFSWSNTAVTPVADNDSFAFVTGGDGGSRLLYPTGENYDFDHVAMKYSFSQVPLPFGAGATAGAYSIASRRTTPDRADMMVVGGDAGHPEVGTAVFVRHGGPVLKKLLAPRAIAATQPPSGFRTAVAYDPGADRWITVGPNGTDVSKDDGRTWTRLSPSVTDSADADKHWQALSLPFVVGPGGRVGRLHDGGGAAAAAGR
jgi:photosystem II stability/assembly factor-like uncharacterized protein